MDGAYVLPLGGWTAGSVSPRLQISEHLPMWEMYHHTRRKKGARWGYVCVVWVLTARYWRLVLRQ